MARRTQIQLGLLVVGLIVWAFGQRNDDARTTLIGVVFFAAAFVLRFLNADAKADDSTIDESTNDDSTTREPPNGEDDRRT